MVIIVVAIVVIVHVVTVIAVVVVVDISVCLRQNWNPFLDEGTRRQAESKNPVLHAVVSGASTLIVINVLLVVVGIYMVIVINMVTRTPIQPQPL